ncbi:origin recognition complex subunit 1 [Plutella xylostella]|uniref:origin recognition complex subunit 1 n=1 Tax=Plutella xylostella TaxID=51655 RepID=UPI00203306B1|nr:origin recognition complex subunit 1 [Plutella xylostella]
MPRKTLPDAVSWLSECVNTDQIGSHNVYYYEKFKFKNLIASVGDFVLVSNADAAEPDAEEGCDAARILALYENREKKSDPFRAKVQWYSRPADLPTSCFNNMDAIAFSPKEVIEDHRPFDTDVSIETFYKVCGITLTFTSIDPESVQDEESKQYNYVCRYRLTAVSKRKFNIEPVMEEERKAIELLRTPRRPDSQSRTGTPKTPSSLVKRMSRVSISEQKNWSISKTEGTKLLLKRAILADKEKASPKKATPKTTPKKAPEAQRTSKTIGRENIADIISMELEENSDDELPTLIIREHIPTTPKRKAPVNKRLEETPKTTLVFESEKETHSTRSGRTTKMPAHYYEEEMSPVKRTPTKSVRKRIMSSSDDDFKPILQTPKAPCTPRTPKTARTPRATPGTKTPKSVSRKIMTSQLTPSLRTRAHSVEKVINYAKQNKSLPGREQQMEEILSFVRSKLLDGTSGCMYISGVPGTGKTATVCASLHLLSEEAGLPQFQLVEVNGMRIAEPRQAYVQVYKQLTGKTVAWEQACSLLEKRFTNPGPRRAPTVLLVDELDALCTRRQDVLYSVMEWAAHGSARLTVLAVANTMDLPERALAARVASRLGLTRLTFPPYTHTQLQHIVATRLAAANVSADAQQLIARKVAAVSGDARRALALCARAVELAGPGSAAGLAEVQRALAEAAAGASVAAIRRCSAAERLLLRAVASEVERTGTDETTLSRALQAAAAIVALDGRPYRSAQHVRAPTPAQAQAICARLAASRLLLLEPRAAEPRLLLNVSADDVHYATRQICV